MQGQKLQRQFMNIRRSWRLSLFASGFCLITLIGWLYFAPALMRSSAYSVRYNVGGVDLEDGVVRKPPFLSDLYYVELPQPQRACYRFFGINFKRRTVFAPVAMYHSPLGFPYIHRDQAHGVDLLFRKIEDEWVVSFSDSV